jgi:hypothetical protein
MPEFADPACEVKLGEARRDDIEGERGRFPRHCVAFDVTVALRRSVCPVFVSCAFALL